MTTTTMVHVRINEKIKAQATKALTAMGLSVSDAVRVFLTRIAADKQLPFTLKVPNAETRAAMAEVDDLLRNCRAHWGPGLNGGQGQSPAPSTNAPKRGLRSNRFADPLIER